MYISKNKHVLSGALMGSALINIAGSAFLSVYRIVLADKVPLLFPAMSSDPVWYGQVFVSVIQEIATMIVFYKAYKKLVRYRGLVENDDFIEMAKLQEEMIPGSISTLSSYSIGQLLQVWAVILIGVRFIYDLSAIVYRDFVMKISEVVIAASLFGGVNLSEIYNNTHGFKYIGMFTAVVLGTTITAIFLRDNFLKGLCMGVTVFFMLAFVVMNMGNISIFGMDVGIVWTSIIFHICETVGLMGLAVYLGRRYRGM